jgi:ureidoglycolate hydrolase
MTRIVRIAAEPLTEASFKPFGQVIEEKDRAPDFRGEKGTLRWNVDFHGGSALLGLIKTPYQGLAFTKLERHFRLSQTFIPLGGAPAVVAVAAPTSPDDREAIPRPEDIHAFLLDGSKGYVLARGTWHSLDRFPLSPPDTRFVMITDRETADDLAAAYAGRGGWQLTQEVDFATRFGVRFEIGA